MDIVRVSNMWNVQYLEGRIIDFDVLDFYIVNQTVDNPLLPEGLNPTSIEYLEIIMCESEGHRIALWVFLKPDERQRLRQFIMSIYDDARFEVV